MLNALCRLHSRAQGNFSEDVRRYQEAMAQHAFRFPCKDRKKGLGQFRDWSVNFLASVLSKAHSLRCCDLDNQREPFTCESKRHD